MKKQIGMALTGVVLAIGALIGCSPPPEPKFDASRAEESLHEIGMYLSEHKKWSTFRFLAAKRVLENRVLVQTEKYETYNNYTAQQITETMEKKYPKQCDEEFNIVSKAADRIR